MYVNPSESSVKDWQGMHWSSKCEIRFMLLVIRTTLSLWVTLQDKSYVTSSMIVSFKMKLRGMLLIISSNYFESFNASKLSLDPKIST